MDRPVRFRTLAGVTTALTFLLVLIGVYTSAKGAGLACSADWPLCSGGVLPQTLPDFIEWSHRLVAMVTGVFILGTAAAAWRWDRADRVRYAATAALALTPVQMLLGAVTVRVDLFTEVGYSAEVQVAHHATALLIFAGLLAATLWAVEESRHRA